MNLTPDQYHTIREGDIVTETSSDRGVTIVTTIEVASVEVSVATIGYCYTLYSKEGFEMDLYGSMRALTSNTKVVVERSTLPPPTSPFIIAYQIRHNRIDFGRKMVKVSDNAYSSISRSGVLIKDRLTPAEEITDYINAELTPTN